MLFHEFAIENPGTVRLVQKFIYYRSGLNIGTTEHQFPPTIHSSTTNILRASVLSGYQLPQRSKDYASEIS